MRRLVIIPVGVLLASLLAFGPAERTAPTRWALIVGVSDYIHYDDTEGGDLPGAEHDALAYRDVLVGRWGFAEENVRVLLNHDATRAAIEEGITGWLAQNARPGDNVIFVFAGHGAQVWDTDGDEEDGLDETIAPADVDPTSPEFDIVDDELGVWLRDLPTNNVVYIHDNCNAGTGTRDVTPFSRARKLGRDVSALERPEGAAGRRALPGQEDESGFDLDENEVLELAAAQPEQAAVDAFFPAEGAEAFHGGAFSTFLIRQLWRAPEGTTYEEVFAAVVDQLRQHRFNQDPHLSADVSLRGAPLFFVEGAGGTGPAAIPVRAVDGSEVELGAGAALGLTVGSVMETEGGARIRLESVGRNRARGSLVSGTTEAGATARAVAYRFPDTELRVGVGGIDTETLEGLRDALSGTSVTLVDDDDAFSHVALSRRGQQIRVVGRDGFARAEGILAGRDGIETLASHLMREASAHELAQMENVGQTFQVELALTGDRTAYGLGERVGFEATSERDGYVTLVDLGTDGTVTVLFPNQYDRNNRIRAGETLRFPTEAMGFEIEAQPPVGRGIVRLFVTAEPMEIPLEDGFFSGRTDAAEFIARTLRDTAGTVAGDAVRLDGWATTTLVYDVTD